MPGSPPLPQPLECCARRTRDGHPPAATAEGSSVWRPSGPRWKNACAPGSRATVGVLQQLRPPRREYRYEALHQGGRFHAHPLVRPESRFLSHSPPGATRQICPRRDRKRQVRVRRCLSIDHARPGFFVSAAEPAGLPSAAIQAGLESGRSPWRLLPMDTPAAWATVRGAGRGGCGRTGRTGAWRYPSVS
jgi:hypothetical protein